MTIYDLYEKITRGKWHINRFSNLTIESENYDYPDVEEFTICVLPERELQPTGERLANAKMILHHKDKFNSALHALKTIMNYEDEKGLVKFVMEDLPSIIKYLETVNQEDKDD